MPSDSEEVEVFGLRMTTRDFDGVCDRIRERILARQTGFVVTPNVNHVCICERDPDFRSVYRQAFLSLPDGVAVMLGARLLGRPLRHKLSGSDMVPALCAFAAREGFSVFFLGGVPGTAERSAQIMADQNPGLRVAGYYCPEYGFEKDPETLERANSVVRAASPDLCFVGLGSPKQELWMSAHGESAGAIVYLGIGGTFDFISGRVRRAPRLMQQIGFEWLWRVTMEPRRLWHRYFVEDLLFFEILWREILAQRRAARG